MAAKDQRGHTTKAIQFIGRATRQDPFYSLVQLFSYFGMPKRKAFKYAISILEGLRFRDRWRRRRVLRHMAPPKVVVSALTASARCNSDEVEGLAVLRQATLAVIERNRNLIEGDQKEFHERCKELRTAPNLDLLRVHHGEGWYEMENVEDYREIFRALAHPDLMSITANYLGGAPVLVSIALVHTTQNDSLLGSQLFHAHSSFDYGKPKEIGIVMNLTDVTPECGPFSYVPADVGLPVIREKSLWQGSRITDENLLSRIDKGDIGQLTGGVGETLFADGSRCIHQGARSTGGSRIVLIAFYSLPHLHGLPSKSMIAMANKSALAPKTEFEALLLREAI